MVKWLTYCGLPMKCNVKREGKNHEKVLEFLNTPALFCD